MDVNLGTANALDSVEQGNVQHSKKQACDAVTYIYRFNIFDHAMNQKCRETAQNFLHTIKFEFGCDIVDGPATEQGVHIVGVRDNSPADDAGLQRWDVVEGVDGVPVSSAVELKRVLSEKGSGSTVVLSVHRGRPGSVSSWPVIVSLGGGGGGYPVQMVQDAKRIAKDEVMVEDWPVWYCLLEKKRANVGESRRVVERVKRDFSNTRPEIGIGFVSGPEGVHITFVHHASPADKAGVLVHDVVEAVDGIVVSDVKVFKAILGSIRPGDVLVMLIHRGPKGGITRGELSIVVGAVNANLSWLSRAHRVMAGVVFPEDLYTWN